VLGSGAPILKPLGAKRSVGRPIHVEARDQHVARIGRLRRITGYDDLSIRLDGHVFAELRRLQRGAIIQPHETAAATEPGVKRSVCVVPHDEHVLCTVRARREACDDDLAVGLERDALTRRSGDPRGKERGITRAVERIVQCSACRCTGATINFPSRGITTASGQSVALQTNGKIVVTGFSRARTVQRTCSSCGNNANGNA